MNNFLEIKSLRAWYGASQALFDVNLKIKEGEIVALLGRNGMGKSTTIKSICGLINNFQKKQPMFQKGTIKDAQKLKE